MITGKQRRAPLGLMWLLLFAAGGADLRAGGPLRFDSSGRSLVYNLSRGPVTYRVDNGGLGRLNHAQAVDLVDSLFKKWEDVPTSSITFCDDGPILSLVGLEPTNVDKTNFILYLNPSRPLGQNIVVFDEDGSIFETLYGANSLVLGFAGPTFISGGNDPAIIESYAFLNGGFIDGNPGNGELSSVEEFAGVFTHEFGHFIGLAHAQVNGLDFRTVPPEAIETMHPILRNGVAQATLKKDDGVSVSSLYPEPSLFSDFGTIQGSYFLLDGQTPFTGANIVARNVADPLLDAVTVVTGETLTPAGRFTLRGLTPGAQYTLRVEAISSTFTGGSSVGPLGSPVSLPGPPEYYNGDRESANPGIDNPDEFTLLTAAAGRTLGNINIIANRFVGVAPETLSMEAGVSQDDPLAVVVTVAGRDPDGDVEQIILDLMSTGTLLVSSRDTRLSALGIKLGGQRDFRFTVFVGDLISRNSLKRFLPSTTGIRVRLIDKEGYISSSLTQPLGSYSSGVRLLFPSVRWGGQISTGLALVNLLADTSINSFFYYDNAGRLLASANNPATRSLFANRQTALFPNQIFDLTDPTDGWLEVRNNTPKVAGFFLQGDFVSGSPLAGTQAVSEGSVQSVLPLLGLPGGHPQRFALVNTQASAATVTLRAFRADGTTVSTAVREIPSHGRVVDGAAGLFGFTGVAWSDGYLGVESNVPVVTLSSLGISESLAIFSGQLLSQSRRLYGAQVATGQEYQTFLNLVNTQNSPVRLVLSFRSPEGNLVASRSDVNIPALGAFQVEVATLFGLAQSANTLYQGWLEVLSENGSISGLITFAGRSGEAFLTTVPLAATPRRQFVLPHVALLGDYFTGLTLLNAGTLRATVQVHVLDETGRLKGQAVVSIDPGHRDARLLEQIVAGLPPQNRGYILLDSDQEIVTFGVFGTSRLDALSAIPGIPR